MAPKQLSGHEKRKRKKEDEKMKKSQAGALHKFLNKPNLEEKEHVQVNLEETEGQEHIEEQETEKEERAETNISEEDVIHNLVDIFDPRRWEGLSSDEIKLLVKNGPKRDNKIVSGPKTNNRRFSAALYTRILSNLEKCDRPWLVYSKELDKIFCFCCKIFRKGHPNGGLDGEGYNDWLHAYECLRLHEITTVHLENMNKWCDMRKRLKLNETIDNIQYTQLKKERDYWMQVLLRIVAVVKFLAKHSLAFRGSKEKLYQKGNGNFLGLIEMLEEFDPIIKEHVRRITNDEVYVHYLGHKIQNELILMLGNEIKKQIIKEVKEAKYYSIILDCTPDSSNQEQMSMIVRYVKCTSNYVVVEESFLGFLNVNDTTGKGLFDVTLEELKCIGLDVNDMRGQGYDNGANMKGIHQGVQTRFLKENPRAFYTPCGCHSLNLTLCDMANSCVKGKNFFGQIQRIYTIFHNSINRWEIFKAIVTDLTLKPLSQTRWESLVECLKAIKMQLVNIREALLEVGEKDNDAAIASEANSIAENELGEFEFLVSIVIWYQVLNEVNIVSKKLQSKDMHIEIAIKEINRLVEYFKDYRETGFSKAIDEAKEIAVKMDVDPVFPQKRLIHRKRRFDESSSSQEVSFTPEEAFRVNYFLYIVDKAILSLKTRFDQFKNYDKLFGFLFPYNLRGIERKDLKSSCDNLENALKYEGKSDINGHELYMELKSFDIIGAGEFKNPFDILMHLNEAQENFPNARIAYRILLTIPVTVASAERSFSKLKLLKNYLRSTMSQQRLSGLAMMTIENEILESINCEEIIKQFATKNARRASKIIS
ncbi:uncharacterized protein [Rutidosis leptorrhynchoides]|uniref:uncharacterized protein n=1 Tax=Rutidosis leptorrhynchoides TaxID=125765 RepID=UPI003A9A4CFD